jgi:uncharacterized protein (TIGR03492 family)
LIFFYILYSTFYILMNLLTISNGKAEDTLAVCVLKELALLVPGLEISALSLVGRGLAYEKAGYKVLGPRQDSPTDGFMMQSFKNFVTDLRAGFLQMSLKQFRAIREAKPDVVFVCGDVYALWAATTFTRNVKPKTFQLQPLVSVYYQDHMSAEERLQRLHRIAVDSFVLPERLMMQRLERVFVRDERSASELQARGLNNVVSYGNVMMDQVVKAEVDLSPLRDERDLLVLLPGSRDDYLFSFPKMLETASHLLEFQIFAAFSGDLNRLTLPTGWTWQEPSTIERSLSAERVAIHDKARVMIFRRAFVACLHHARVVLGTAGTANEQAAGSGIPVVSFPTHGPQFTELFANAQKRLLGDAVFLLQADPIQLAHKIKQVSSDETLRSATKRAGSERIGKSGAARKIALDIASSLNS